jgi:hypothetical protein
VIEPLQPTWRAASCFRPIPVIATPWPNARLRSDYAIGPRGWSLRPQTAHISLTTNPDRPRCFISLSRDPADEAVRLVDEALAVVLEREREGVGDFVGFGGPRRWCLGRAGRCLKTTVPAMRTLRRQIDG